jgi:trimethylamine-N-oxide reductase (cytochrome c)
MSNHPRFRFHVQGDDIDWIREIGKVRGPDGYMYEPCWIHPSDAGVRGISDGDVIMVHNERGAVLAGAVVTQRIIPGALGIEHGAKIDLAVLNGKPIDRGGCINLITPSPVEKYAAGEEIKIPEMNVTGYLAEATKIDVSEIVAGTGVGHGSAVSG